MARFRIENVEERVKIRKQITQKSKTNFPTPPPRLGLQGCRSTAAAFVFALQMLILKASELQIRKNGF